MTPASRRAAWALALFIGLAAPAAAQQAPSASSGPIQVPLNLWPLIYQNRTPHTSELELLFSLFDYSRDQRKTDLAVRPFYWHEADPDRDAEGTAVLWPLSDYKREKDVSRLWILPLFWRRANDQMSRTFLFPLFSHKREGRATRLGVIGYTPITLFDFQRNPEKDRTYQRYVLWTHTREGAHSEWSFLPLYEQDTSPGRMSYSLIPLYAYYRSTADDAMRVSALGFPDTYNLFEYRRRGKDYTEWHDLLVYHLNSESANRLVLFPIYWDLRSHKDRFFQVWPFFGFEDKGTSVEHSTLWPFFRWRYDEPKGEREVNLLWPLFKSAIGPGERRQQRFFPFYEFTSNPDSERRPSLLMLELISPLPVTYSASGKGYSYSRLLWLGWWADNDKLKLSVLIPYYSVENKQEHWKHRGFFPVWNASHWDDSTFTFVLPTYISYSDPALLARTFFPIFYQYRSTETAWSAVLPSYFSYKSTSTVLNVLFPLYYHYKDNEQDSELRYFFPFYGTYRRGSQVNSHLLVFPLYASYSDKASQYHSFDALWPLIHHDVSTSAYSTRVLPIYWSSEEKDSGFRVVFPLYWDFRSPEASQRHVLPFYGSYHEAGGFSLTYWLGPLYARIDDPEKQYSKQEWLGFLAGRTTEGEETRSYVFPLLWTKSAPGASRLFLLPLLGYERAGPERDAFLLGFTQDWSLFHIASDPSTGFSETRALIFYSRGDSGSYTDVVFPLFWAWGDLRSTNSIFFPFFEWQRDDRLMRRELSVLGLSGGLSLFHFLHDESEERRLDRVLLFERNQRHEDVQTVGFPLFWRWTEPDQTRTFFFPFYSSHTGGDESMDRFGVLGVTPLISLFSSSNEADEATSRLWPLYGWRYEKSAHAFELGFIGVYYPYTLLHWRSAPEAFEHHLFPLYFYDRAGAAASPARTVHLNLLWQVVTYEREGADEKDFRFLWRLVRVQHDHGDSDVEVNPFYFRLKKKDEGSYWAILGGLLGKQTDPTGAAHWRFLWAL